MVEKPEQFDLPPGSPFQGGHHRYGVSWGHQYHCVRMMRDEFFAQLHNRSTLVGMEVDLNKEEYTTEEIRLIHLAHCYDYLRQVILCHMDMTIEYPTGNSVAKGTISGYEVPHQCVKR
ncbi:conserved hypothetical protein [Talaromyces stipitatus ATCC 10500]|uniref:Uncharacterized protein n=1 Tax=Talaromyces stipitatus (strain ATCC 10500 / CBS 375.48 / QM 6759 / NRRL 1006) TaxID=441959 RepID=B8MI65_TALSN|nr:uncharacterized protein TSTA_022810 [Talaromyces stipitatus ATCC 10500]EED17227.1 conserved hypothetical protein [Talaromyces stipitatus ATCC 10500]